MMLHRPLGRTGLNVSIIGVGTCQLRMVSEQQALDALERAFALGVNLVHTANDYEGADNLVAEAVAASGRKVIVACQGYGAIENFRRLFELACAKLRKRQLELFGIACVDDRERSGENVWQPGGVVEYLAAQKRQGRLLATFCTTHGTPDYIRRLILSGAFDAIMLAYNPLGYHLLSYNPPDSQQQESLSANRDLFSLAAERGVGLMVMKPLAGGLLCESRAFRPHLSLSGHLHMTKAGDILRHILYYNPQIACVLPGVASAEEAEEDALAGHGPLEVATQQAQSIHQTVGELQATLCNRCGHCDKLCSQHLPVSWLFRAAYIENQRSMPFETPAGYQYFDLHPPLESALCASCPAITCHCPLGLNIPASLVAIHQLMVYLRRRGLVDVSTPATPLARAYDARLVRADIDACSCRLTIQNSGADGWHVAHGHPAVTLEVWAGSKRLCQVPLRGDVAPGQCGHFPFELAGRLIGADGAPTLHLVFREGPRDVTQSVALGSLDTGRIRAAR